MDVGVGTFNLNNLFSRFNFRADLETATRAAPGIAGRSSMDGGDEAADEPTATYTFGEESLFVTREYMGRLVRAKPEVETERIAERIVRANLDVLAVQEVEDVVTLRGFVQEWLDGLYPFAVLVEGNDPRLIDLALLSKLPIGGITSWQWAVHPDDPSETVFSRDLLEVEILNPRRTERIFTLYNNHLKSHYVPFNQDQVEGARRANERRQRQAEMTARIVIAQQRPNSRYVVLGDMNDPPESDFLAPMVTSAALGLSNALANPRETRPAPDDDPPPPGPAWTHRYKPRGEPAEYELFDQIWLSPSLTPRQTDAVIDRRQRLTGDGSDHDLAWVTLDL